MDASEKEICQLTIRGISRAAAKRIAEDWAGSEMVWLHGVAYPSNDNQPCIISVMNDCDIDIDILKG